MWDRYVKFFERNKKNKGITLISLIITIIVLLILIAVSVNLISGSEGIISKAERAEFMNKIAKYKEEVEMYNAIKAMDELVFNTENIYAGYLLKNAINAKEENFKDIDISTVKNLEEIIEDIQEADEKYLVVYKGKLYYVENENITKKQQEICEQLDVPCLNLKSNENLEEDVAVEFVNKPDLTGFNENTTFYVTYDDDGNEYSTIPINKDEPENWYKYDSSLWANVVTRNNEMEVYYTWIPRYEYKLDTDLEMSIVKFIKVTQTEPEDGYQIPEAFKFNNQELTGYWTMKYIAEEATETIFSTETTATDSSIRTKGITGSSVASQQVYNYYIDGEFKGKTTNASDNFVYTNLEANKEYTILVEIRNSSTNVYLGSVVKQIKTVDANEPELMGFNEDMTYYVTYDTSGNSIIGDKIKNDGSNKPNGWYDYSTNNWANIVVTDGTVINEKISNATMTTYYVWIPRYEYKITEVQAAQKASARTDVRFLSGTSKDTDLGYQIPEAFKFNNQELTGYWAMKYTAGE